MDTRIIDIRSEAPALHPKGRASNGRTLARDPAQITTVMVHQAGVLFSGEPVERVRDVACHAMAFEHVGVLAEPCSSYLLHGDRANSCAVGIEIDGVYPGLASKRTAAHTPWTEQRRDIARATLAALVEACRADGCPLRWIVAHRQATAGRAADPGEEIWRDIVERFAVPELGLEIAPARVWLHRKERRLDGLPIPVEWSPSGVNRYRSPRPKTGLEWL